MLKNVKPLIFISFLFSTMIIFNSCEEEEVTLESKITDGNYKITGHCFEAGSRLFFRSDGTGKIHWDDECIVGYECHNNYDFNWTLSGTTLSVTYSTDWAVKCNEGIRDPDKFPPPETRTFENDGETIYLLGNKWDMRN